MKKVLFLSVLASLLLSFGASRAMAYDHDSKGWYDSHHHRQPFITHNHHRGFWDQRNGARVFINID
jgi:hypothetical protein